MASSVPSATARTKQQPNTAPLQVTRPVTVATGNFRFSQDWNGMEIIAAMGAVIGYDGDILVRTPYDNCGLVQPSREPGKGRTAVRFGREI